MCDDVLRGHMQRELERNKHLELRCKQRLAIDMLREQSAHPHPCTATTKGGTIFRSMQSSTIGSASVTVPSLNLNAKNRHAAIMSRRFTFVTRFFIISLSKHRCARATVAISMCSLRTTSVVKRMFTLAHTHILIPHLEDFAFKVADLAERELLRDPIVLGSELGIHLLVQVRVAGVRDEGHDEPVLSN